jgi:hypothetical protein
MEEVEDTSIIISKVCEQWYEDTYKGEGIKVHWKAHIVDCIIDEMSFPEVFCPKDIITIKSKVDTCIDKRPEYKPKNHIGMSIGLLGNNINKFPNIETDFWWTIKDKWGIYGGGEYNVYHNEFYARLGVKVFFK